MSRNHRALSPDLAAVIIAAVQSGEPPKAVARQFGLPYRTAMTILERAGLSTKATDDPERLRTRERWARNTEAYRARRAA